MFIGDSVDGLIYGNVPKTGAIKWTIVKIHFYLTMYIQTGGQQISIIVSTISQ